MASDRIAVVDSRDRFLRWADRSEVHHAQLLHRSVHVLLFDRSGRLWLQRRHPAKRTYPGAWDLSASGHVEELDYPAGPDDELDAVYAAVAQRELEEELGVRTELAFLGAFGPELGVHYEQIRLYRGNSDGPFCLQSDEVTAVRAVNRAELAAMFSDSAVSITPTLRWFADWMARVDLF